MCAFEQQFNLNLSITSQQAADRHGLWLRQWTVNWVMKASLPAKIHVRHWLHGQELLTRSAAILMSREVAST